MSASDMFALVTQSLDDWGAVANYDRPVRDGTTQVFVHHPGYAIRDAADGGNVQSEKATLRDIEKNAMAGPWWGIQYDVIVGQSGHIYAGRGLARSGATSGDVDDDGTHNNTEGEAICVLVRPGTPMTLDARESLKRLLDASGVAPDDMYGHREAKGTATSCPGDDRMEFLEAYRSGEFDEPVPSEPDVEWDGGDTYEVEDGDTLWAISQAVGRDVADLAAWNHMEDTDLIHPGQVLTVAPPQPEPKPGSTYMIDVERETVRKVSGWTSDPLVKVAQGLLLAHGEGPEGLVKRGRPDGVFGWGTHRAVLRFQQRVGLDEVDGIIGPDTWAALENGA